MTKAKHACLLVLGFLVSGSVVLAGSNSLKGRSTIELSIGLWHESNVGSEISNLGVVSTAKTSGFLGDSHTGTGCRKICPSAFPLACWQQKQLRQ